MRSHVGWRGKRNIAYKGVGISTYQTCFKTMRLMAIRNGSKRTISTRSKDGLLQTVSKLGTEQCVSEDAAPLRDGL